MIVLAALLHFAAAVDLKISKIKTILTHEVAPESTPLAKNVKPTQDLNTLFSNLENPS